MAQRYEKEAKELLIQYKIYTFALRLKKRKNNPRNETDSTNQYRILC